MKTTILKKNHKFCEIPEGSAWKIDLVKELINIKMNVLTLDFGNENMTIADEIESTLSLVTTE